MSSRLALGAFVLYLIGSWWVLVFVLGSDVWFLRDDWMFLSGRDGGSLTDVLRPYDLHPVALPVVAYRLMFNLFGLWFTPYLVLIVTMHLGVAAMLRVIMRRAGVGPWLASVAAGTLVLFGHGEQNIHWAFQITMVGSVLLGLAQLVLADHDGRPDRRDAAGVLAGIGAVMCSGVGPLMVVSVGVATLVRRGWRMAVLHTAPPAAVYGLWALLENPTNRGIEAPTFRVVLDWVREGQVGTLEAIGGSPIAGVLLAVLLVAGVALLVSSVSIDDLRRRVAVPAGLVVCGPLLFALVARQRSVFGIELARSSRYLYIGAVCLLPALAVAGDAIVRRWRPAAAAVVAVLLIGVPANIDVFGQTSFVNPGYFEAQRQAVLGLPRAPEAEQVPRWVRPLPDPFNGEDLTIGWLLDVRDAGRLPSVDLDPRLAARFPVMLGLAQLDREFEGRCETHAGAVILTLDRGDELGIRDPIEVSTVSAGRARRSRVGFDPLAGETLSVQLPLEVRIAAVFRGETFTLCR